MKNNTPQFESGYYGDQGSVTAPSGFKFTNGSTGKFIFDGKSHIFDVVPVNVATVNDTVNYKLDGVTISTIQINGVPGEWAQTAIDNNAPANYHVISGDTTTYANRSTPIDVDVVGNDVTDTIHFIGDSADDSWQRGRYNTKYNVSAPTEYHYIDNDTGNLTYSGIVKSLYVAPNEVKVQFMNGNNKVGTVQKIDTSNVDGNSISPILTAPNGDKLASLNNTLVFVNNGYDHIYKVPVVSKNSSYDSDQIDFSGNSAANTVMRGNGNGFVPAPVNYHFIDGYNGQFKYDNGTHTFRVAPNEVLVQFQYKGQNIGSLIPVNITTASDDVSSAITGSIPEHYQLANTVNNITFGDNGYDAIHKIDLAASDVTDQITFNGDSNANSSISGIYGSDVIVTAPPGYYFTDGNENEKVVLDGNPKTFDVTPLPNIDTDSIVFDGDTAANESVDGADKRKGQVNAPAGYHFTNGDTGAFTFNGQTHTFHVAKDTQIDTETITFNGDDDPATNTEQVSGIDGNRDYILAPIGFEFTDGNETESFIFGKNNNKANFSVIKVSNVTKTVTPAKFDPSKQGQKINETATSGTYPMASDLSKTVTRTINYVDENGTSIKPADPEAVKFTRTATIDTVTGEVTYSKWTATNGTKWAGVSLPTISGYSADKRNNQDQGAAEDDNVTATTADQSYTFHFKKNTKEDTDTIVYNGDPNNSYSVTASDGSTGYVGMPEGYRFSDFSEQHTFTFNGGTHVFNVVKLATPHEVTDHVDYDGDSDADFTVTGMSGTTGYIDTLKGYYFADGSEQEQFTFNGGTHTVQVIPFTNPNQPVMDTDTVEYIGDPAANFTVKGVAGSMGYINTLQGYYFTDGSEQEHFTFNGGVHKAYVKPFTSPTPSQSAPSESNEIGATFDPELVQHPTVNKSNSGTNVTEPVHSDSTKPVQSVPQTEVPETQDISDNQFQESNQVPSAKVVTKPVQNKQQTTVTPNKAASQTVKSNLKPVEKKQPVVETVQFTGVKNSAVQIKGTKGTQKSVVAPNGYHYANGNNVQPVTFDGKQHVLPVIKDKNN